MGWASVTSKRLKSFAPPSSRPPSGTRSALRAGCRLGTKVSRASPSASGRIGGHESSWFRSGVKGPPLRTCVVRPSGPFEVSKDAISSRVACVQGGTRTVTPSGEAPRTASPRQGGEGPRERSAHRECLERCWVIRGKEGSKAGSRRLTLGEPLGLRPALRRAAATRCTSACGETALRFQVFALFLATLGVENPKSPHLIRLRPAFRGCPPPACGTLLAALVASVTSFALDARNRPSRRFRRVRL